MPIPGVTPELPLRAKVRVGEKNSRGLPQSLDHFVCDDERFEELAGAKPTFLYIRFPYATVEECFPSGLEKWMRSRSGTQILGCYTKGDGTAHRLGKTRDSDGLVVLDPTPGSSRLSMPCAAQRCPYYGSAPDQGCRPQARLCFFLDGDEKRDSVFKFETKSLNTYEEIAAVLAQYPDLRQPLFEIRAERRKKGPNHFTVVTIREVGALTQAPPPADSASATAAAAETGDPAPAPSPRQALRDYLEATGRWPVGEAQAEWIRRLGPEKALHNIKARDAQRGR